MSALPAPRIDSVNTATKMVTFTVIATGVQYERHYLSLKKNALIKACSFVGVKFYGAPPMQWDLDKIQSRFNEWMEAQEMAKPPHRQPQPTPAPEEEPMPKPTTPSTEVDVAMQALMDAVRQASKGGIDKDEVVEIVTPMMYAVNRKVDDVKIGVDNLTIAISSEIDSLKEQIASVIPNIIEVHVPNKPVKVVDGLTHYQFPKVLAHLASGNHVFMVGKAGSGKTSIAEMASEALGIPFSSKSCTSQTTESSLVGFMNATGYVSTEFRKAFEFGHVFNLDEIDHANPNVLGVLNSALANKQMAFPDGMVTRHDNFIVVASGNTFGTGATAQYVGANPIDAATKDRFAVMEIHYDEAIEDAMVASVGLEKAVATKWLATVRKCRVNVDTHGLKIVVSPRASMIGAKMLKSGAFTNMEVLEQAILKGTKPDQTAKVLDGVSF
jgi:hypothetical protein